MRKGLPRIQGGGSFGWRAFFCGYIFILGLALTGEVVISYIDNEF